MLRTVAEFSAVTLPIPVKTIGKFCFCTVAAMTGTGGGASGIVAAGPCAKCRQPRATAIITRPTIRGRRRPLFPAGLSVATDGAAMGAISVGGLGSASGGAADTSDEQNQRPEKQNRATDELIQAGKIDQQACHGDECQK